jgi:hypothetical protein
MGAQVNYYMNVFTVLSLPAIQKTFTRVREATFMIQRAAVAAASMIALI